MDLPQVVRHIGDMLAGMDVRYDLGDANPLVGTLCADMKLTRPDGVVRLAELLQTGRGLLLDLADRTDVRRIGAAWSDRVDVIGARADRDDVDALLLRPDGCVAWALTADADVDVEEPSLATALGTWFGRPDFVGGGF
jgi:hypothetical protein